MHVPRRGLRSIIRSPKIDQPGLFVEVKPYLASRLGSTSTFVTALEPTVFRELSGLYVKL